MCKPTESESGQLLTIKPCGWYLALKSDRDRLAGVVAGMEEQNARNLDALRRAEADRDLLSIERDGLENVKCKIYDKLFPNEPEDEKELRWKWILLKIDDIISENARLREALQSVEWNGPRFESCTYCNETESNGHYDDCLVGNALKEVG